MLYGRGFVVYAMFVRVPQYPWHLQNSISFLVILVEENKIIRPQKRARSFQHVHATFAGKIGCAPLVHTSA